jgi:hypothetical protein
MQSMSGHRPPGARARLPSPGFYFIIPAKEQSQKGGSTMVAKFNVRDYIEKVWVPEESQFLRVDLQQYYRAVFQYLAKREKAVAGREAADAFKPALIGFLSAIKTKIDDHVDDAEIETSFAAPVGRLFAKKGECENDKYELPFVKKTVEFLKLHQGYLTKKDLKGFKAAFEAFLKSIYAQVKESYNG